jgi:hypothetical protein
MATRKKYLPLPPLPIVGSLTEDSRVIAAFAGANAYEKVPMGDDSIGRNVTVATGAGHSLTVQKKGLYELWLEGVLLLAGGGENFGVALLKDTVEIPGLVLGITTTLDEEHEYSRRFQVDLNVGEVITMEIKNFSNTNGCNLGNFSYGIRRIGDS